MENEYREREQPKVKYEQPMDAVRGKKPKVEQPKERRKAAAGELPPAGNELRDKVVVTEKAPSDKKDKKERKKSEPAKRPNLFIQVLNGDILTRDIVLNNLTFIFFILFLLMLMVGKGYYGKQLAKDIDTLDTEVRAKTAEYIENKARLEEATTRYRLVESLRERGLKETVNPAKVIRLKQKENEQ